ncbi:unnamed protein product [Danaus chrysippus]|uniref:(African queen) hypothetical protein n=1 Tax=Danaus chrysippus TaxID=151541 RepID=A0A8J2WC62_9NEOP|nr:unnamed protein product [Danaus chrysippus]
MFSSNRLCSNCSMVRTLPSQSDANDVIAFPPWRGKQPKTFAFDHCFFSLEPTLPHFASQKTVFECLGRDILDNAFDGYNACIFAYGQTDLANER